MTASTLMQKTKKELVKLVLQTTENKEQNDQKVLNLEVKLKEAISNFEKSKEEIIENNSTINTLQNTVNQCKSYIQELQTLNEDYKAEIDDNVLEIAELKESAKAWKRIAIAIGIVSVITIIFICL